MSLPQLRSDTESSGLDAFLEEVPAYLNLHLADGLDQGENPLQKGAWCIDWHNVLQFYREDNIRPEPKAALKKLLGKGIPI